MLFTVIITSSGCQSFVEVVFRHSKQTWFSILLASANLYHAIALGTRGALLI
jgi:hypothetical protein